MGVSMCLTQRKQNFLKINVFQPHQDILPVNSDTILGGLDMPSPLSSQIKHFSPSDIKFAIQKHTFRKSPGYDLITAEVARCLPKRAIVLLTHIYIMPYSDCHTSHFYGSSPKSYFSQNQTSPLTW